MSKLIICKECGKEISEKAKACPNCGAKNKKPIFKRLWFWLIVAAVFLTILGNSDPSPEKEKNPTEPTQASTMLDITTKEQSTTTEQSEETQTQAEEEPVTEKLVDGMRPEFKEAMDSYEEFFDEYCDFMEKYSNNPNDISLLYEYSKYIEKYTDFMEKIEKWEDEDMNDAELKYYIEVTARIEKRLLEVAY